ncbi:MAG TPA: response regulator [Bryobacteraceae bacterium]|jgi:CheY-like chemotaxis protein
MNESKALAALFPGPRRLILSAIFGEPERWWSTPELAGRAGLQPASLRLHIGLLRNGGLLRERNERGQVVFQANPESPVYSELRAIVGKLTTNHDGGETILVVEDHPATAQITRILLESWGYRVLEAHHAAEAISIFERHGPGIGLLLTDVIMPGMSGPQLACELQKGVPQLRVIFMSGYPADEAVGLDAAFLAKPFNPASLSRLVRRELDRRPGARHMKSP